LGTLEHYKWWHPQDHKGLQWDSKWSRSYIGATCVVDESLAGSADVYRLHIKFHAPQDIFPAADLKTARAEGNASAFVCATIGFGDKPQVDAKGNMIGGRFIHAAYDTPSGCFLRNRFWLGAGIEAPKCHRREHSQSAWHQSNDTRKHGVHEPLQVPAVALSRRELLWSGRSRERLVQLIDTHG
jgi:DAPG hydrolase PhiG domain